MFFAERDLEAGEEIFANYGTEWLDSREGKYVDFGSVVPGLADSPALAMLSFNETSTTVFTTFYHSVIGSKLLGNDKVVSLVYGDKNFASPVHHYRLLLFFIHTMIISIQLLQKGRKLTLRVLQSWKRLLH